MSYHLAFELEGLPKMPNDLYRGHWRRRSGFLRRWSYKVVCASDGRTPEAPLTKANVKLTRFSFKEPDYDGLVGSFKPILDGLVRAGILLDDKVEIIGRPEYVWEKCPMRKGKIKVEVSEA